MYGLVSLRTSDSAIHSSILPNESQILGLPVRGTGGITWRFATFNTSRNVVSIWSRTYAIFTCHLWTFLPNIRGKVNQFRKSDSLATTVSRFNPSQLFPVQSHEEACLWDFCRLGGSRNYSADMRSYGACVWKHALCNEHQDHHMETFL